MNFEQENLYHIYNQGNSKQKIFFSRDNYLFFLEKMKKHLLPHSDILAWCLMPNHFHLMIYVHTLEIEINASGTDSCSTTLSRATTKSDILSPATNDSRQSLNKSIGILLSSYTRSINLQEYRSGSLFKQHTKAECLTGIRAITSTFFNTPFGAQINVRVPEKEYPQTCFNYIHDNPVKSKLVSLKEDWEFSSYPDYCGVRNGKLINRERAREFGLFV